MKTFYQVGHKVVLALGIGTALFMFLPVLRFENLEHAGFEVVFGQSLIDINPFNLGSVASAKLPFSILGFLAFSLAALAGIIAFVSKRLILVSLGLFLASAFLLWSLPESINVVYTVLGNDQTLSVDWIRLYGLYGAMTASILGALASLALALKA